ncbi:hypothetical protein, partial [Kitasatospora sp. NPDC056531]|uniref:hypothetical protein n=1 Tax=Kitasatospora sp. NPDC056531 TaxID=3345856 RepID=UPI0036AF8111
MPGDGVRRATVLHTDAGSRYRSRHARSGRSRTGRLLELVRAELAAEQHGSTHRARAGTLL